MAEPDRYACAAHLSERTDRILVSVHAYSPYDFAMNAAGYKVWDGSKAGDLNFIDKLNETYVQKGVGVVIGEFGATNKDNLEDRVRWADDFTKRAVENKISCMLWDNSGTKVGTENFGMIDRIGKKVYFPEILEAMTKNYN